MASMMPTEGSGVGFGQGESLGARLRQRRSNWGAFVLSADWLDSSNLLASSLAKRGAPHGSVVVASSQSAGRGRWSRRWDSEPGGIYLSVVLRPDETGARSLDLLPLASAVAASEALTRASGIEARLHWPNDLYVERRKIAGILCESTFTGARLEAAVVGIGINVNQSPESFSPEVASRASSVRAILGRELPIADLALEVVMSLEAWLDREWGDEDRARVLARFEEIAVGVEGLRVRVVSREGESYLAETRGIAPDGGLRVELEDGTIQILRSDDVHLLDE